MVVVENTANILKIFLAALLFAVLSGCISSQPDSVMRQHNALNMSSNQVSSLNLSQTDFTGSELDLAELLAYAAENNQELKSIYYRWQASKDRAPQVAALPDPKLSYGYLFKSAQTKTGPKEQTVSISQTLPWFGKLSLKERIAVKYAESVAHEYDMAIRNIASKVKKSYYEYAWLYDAVRINREHINLLKVIESVASTRFKSGKMSQSTLIQIQIEQGKIEDRVKELEALKSPLSNSIYAALGAESGELLPPPVRAQKTLIDLDATELKMQMELTNPELKRISVLKEQQELAVRLADKDYYPDLTFGLSYIDTDGGNDPILAMVSINLPIWRTSLDAAKREAVNQRQSVSESLTNTRLELAAKLDLMVYYYQNALRKNKLYENTLIPKAQQSIDLAIKGFETGSVSFADLLNAERTFLEFQLDTKRHAADASQQLAEIEALTGSGVRSQGSGVRSQGSARFGSVD